MKFVIRFVVCCVLFLCATLRPYAQDTVWHSTYVLDRFLPGSVLLKSGQVEQAPLNYDAARQGISFLKDQKVYNLTGIETVDTVYINDRKFIPANDIFYEVLAKSPVELYATYSCKAQPVRAAADHGGTSRKAMSQVSNAVSEVYLNRPYREGVVMAFRKHFWLRRYRDFYKVNTERSVIKLFPRKEMAIKEFVKSHKTDFNNQADVAQLLTLCLE